MAEIDEVLRRYCMMFQVSDAKQPVVISLNERDELKATLEAWLENPEHAELSEWEIRVNLVCIEAGLVFHNHFYFNPLAFNLRTRQFVPHVTPMDHEQEWFRRHVHNVRKYGPYTDFNSWKAQPHPYRVVLAKVMDYPRGFPVCFRYVPQKIMRVHTQLMSEGL